MVQSALIENAINNSTCSLIAHHIRYMIQKYGKPFAALSLHNPLAAAESRVRHGHGLPYIRICARCGPTRPKLRQQLSEDEDELNSKSLFLVLFFTIHY